MSSDPSPWISVGDGKLSYAPDPGVLTSFEAAANLLEGELNREVAYRDPRTNQPVLAADLVLEGGGVKGIALAGAVLVLDKAGYRFPRVAGTSAGAIAAALIAAIQKAGRPMQDLGSYLAEVQFGKFMEGSKLQNWATKLGKLAGDAVDGGELLHHMGLYSGDYLYTWLDPILADLKITNFSDLAIPLEADPQMDLAEDQRYGLVVHTSDITRGLLVRLPWDDADYGIDPASHRIADAVRASMSIPFFFEPFRQHAAPAVVAVPQADGSKTNSTFEGGDVTWVDGGMLSNFPINAFDRTDGRAPRWPTVGIKLSAQPLITPVDVPVTSTAREAMRCLHTMMNEWDRYAVEDSDASRIIFINNAGIKATQFDLSPEQQQMLFTAGAETALHFVIDQAKQHGSLRTDPAQVSGTAASAPPSGS